MCEKIMTRPVRFPSKYNVPKDAQDFVKGLLQRNPQRRLCCGFHRAGELKNNPFFADMNWDHLERGLVAPPFLPKVSSRLASDAQNFENLSTFQRIALQKGEKSISTQTKEAASGEREKSDKVGGGVSASPVARSASSATSTSLLDGPGDGAEGASFSSQTVAQGEATVEHSKALGRGDEASVGAGGAGAASDRDSDSESLSPWRSDLFADFDYIAVVESFDTGGDGAIQEGDESEK
jgi:hypothetical protein